MGTRPGWWIAEGDSPYRVRCIAFCQTLRYDAQKENRKSKAQRDFQASSCGKGIDGWRAHARNYQTRTGWSYRTASKKSSIRTNLYSPLKICIGTLIKWCFEWSHILGSAPDLTTNRLPFLDSFIGIRRNFSLIPGCWTAGSKAVQGNKARIDGTTAKAGGRDLICNPSRASIS